MANKNKKVGTQINSSQINTITISCSTAMARHVRQLNTNPNLLESYTPKNINKKNIYLLVDMGH